MLVKAEHAGRLTRLAQYFVRQFPVPASEGLRLAWDRDPWRSSDAAAIFRRVTAFSPPDFLDSALRRRP